MWAFARLGVKLPPAFASSSQRRLQVAMGQLPATQLVRMLWSLASSGFHPTEPQLRAYAQKVCGTPHPPDFQLPFSQVPLHTIIPFYIFLHKRS